MKPKKAESKPTRIFSIVIIEQCFKLRNPGDIIGRYEVNVTEDRTMETSGPPEIDDLLPFLTRATSRFMRKWAKKNQGELTAYERNHL